MSAISIHFAGVCTHVTNVPITPPPDAVSGTPLEKGRYRRAILADGRLGLRLDDQGLPPHQALLVIPKVFLDEELRSPEGPPRAPGLQPVTNLDFAIWELEGASLYVADAIPGVTRTESFSLLPSLTERARVLSLQLDSRVVQEGQAAAMVDIFAGELDAYRDHEAVHAKLTVATATDEPQLVVTRIWDQERSRITLHDAEFKGLVRSPQIFIMNVGIATDKEIDFLLHYQVTTWTPPPGFIPEPGDLSAIRPMSAEERLFAHALPDGLSGGCSNSVYP